ncbi:E3 SUMO-protein ligase NSE2 [Nomia melanderi]|uniref:E3 SUMO-protein ligase NSE2 n=1 Tax=Nomia melanderi TaxID=2448451 RepID=UPI001304413F|nr:E3 SUMO-protein ligase NSE2-like [Nomia melanderi]
MTQSQQVIEELHDCYIKTAANLISYYGGNELKEKLQEMRDIVKNNCIIDKKLKALENTKNNLLNSYDDESTEADIETIVQEYKTFITEINTDMSDDNRLINFDRQVEALLDKIGDDEDNEDEEMQLTGGYINVIDPISKKRIVDPVKNNVCGHTYDRESITQILKINKKTRCPVIGCKSTEFVKLQDLRVDFVTKTYLEKNPA